MFLPTYEICRKICDYYHNFQFMESVEYIEGYKISVFAYRLIQYKEFVNPLPEYPDITAYEMRGITFVFNSDGTLYKRFLALPKFFNLDQAPNTQYNDLKHLNIKSVYEKLDGSLINFIELPNKKVIAKSLKGLSNEFSDYANYQYNNNIFIKKAVDYAIANDYTPIFEYISPFNRIVVKYSEFKLVLTRFRNNITGEVVDIHVYPYLDEIFHAEKLDMNWSDVLDVWKWTDNCEGVVVELENGKLFKRKTEAYCTLHKLTTELIYKVDYLIKEIVNETIDDIIANLDITDREILYEIDKIIDITIEYLKNTSRFIEKKVEQYHSINDRKEYAISYRKEWYFRFVMSAIDGRDILSELKKDLLAKTYHYEVAKSFIVNRGFEKYNLNL